MGEDILIQIFRKDLCVDYIILQIMKREKGADKWEKQLKKEVHGSEGHFTHRKRHSIAKTHMKHAQCEYPREKCKLKW